MGPYRATGLTGLPMGDYLKQANDITLAIAMVETRAALDALDDILSVPGIDGVFVGPPTSPSRCRTGAMSTSSTRMSTRR